MKFKAFVFATLGTVLVGLVASTSAVAQTLRCPEGSLYSRALDGRESCVSIPLESAATAATLSEANVEGWRFGDANGICMARFRSSRYAGVISLVLSKSADAAFLMFEGQQIDQLQIKGRTKRVVLRQPTEGDQVALAQWTAATSQHRARLAFRIPSLKDALGSIEPVQSFEVLVDSRAVFKGDWQDGARARDVLAGCLRK